MAKRTTSQKHAELRRLGGETKQNIYVMLKLADEILLDVEYVDKFGSEAELMELMENEEFSHFGGNPSLPAMLRAYRHNKDEAVWQEYSYNIRVLIDLATPERDQEAIARINWKTRCAELEEQIEVLKHENQTLRDLIIGQRMAAV